MSDVREPDSQLLHLPQLCNIGNMGEEPTILHADHALAYEVLIKLCENYEPVIIEMKDSDVIAGRIDGCDDSTVCLYIAHRPAEGKGGRIPTSSLPWRSAECLSQRKLTKRQN